MTFDTNPSAPLAGWMKHEGPDADIVLTSRARLARNLDKHRFTHLASEAELEGIIREVSQAMDKAEDIKGMSLLQLATSKPIEREVLVGKHLISSELAKNFQSAAVILSKDEEVSVMINEEDHLRIQVLLSGLQLDNAWSMASKIDDALEAHLTYAFSEEAGYLTACPTNVGTGLRVSVMLHLPALAMINHIGEVLAAVSHLGLAVRGLYGEGTEALGNIYQVSNQVTLGYPESELVQNVENIANQIVMQERNARAILLREGRRQLEDRVYRAYGVLSNARIITTKEALELLSSLRLGSDLKLIDTVEPGILNELLPFIQPGYLEKANEKGISSFERDVKRADLICERFARYRKGR